MGGGQILKSRKIKTNHAAAGGKKRKSEKTFGEAARAQGGKPGGDRLQEKKVTGKNNEKRHRKVRIGRKVRAQVIITEASQKGGYKLRRRGGEIWKTHKGQTGRGGTVRTLQRTRIRGQKKFSKKRNGGGNPSPLGKAKDGD